MYKKYHPEHFICAFASSNSTRAPLRNRIISLTAIPASPNYSVRDNGPVPEKKRLGRRASGIMWSEVNVVGDLSKFILLAVNLSIRLNTTMSRRSL